MENLIFTQNTSWSKLLAKQILLLTVLFGLLQAQENIVKPHDSVVEYIVKQHTTKELKGQFIFTRYDRLNGYFKNNTEYVVKLTYVLTSKENINFEKHLLEPLYLYQLFSLKKAGAIFKNEEFKVEKDVHLIDSENGWIVKKEKFIQKILNY